MMTEGMIRQMAADLDIPMIGFTTAEPLTDFQVRLEERAYTPFCHIEPKKRIDFKQAFSKAETVIVIGLPYRLKRSYRHNEQKTGRFAAFCLERDYHQRVKEKLTVLAETLKQVCDFDYRSFVDQAQLIDRASAWRAGLGFFGKNNCLIHPEYGSAFVIGQLLVSTKIDFEPVEPMMNQCGTCRKCLDACPNHALGEGFDLRANDCISYLTQKKKLTDEERSKIKTWLYGCDFCQLVCPYNDSQSNGFQSSEKLIELETDLEEICRLTDEGFRQRFEDTALFWRGREVLVRNAGILSESLMVNG